MTYYGGSDPQISKVAGLSGQQANVETKSVYERLDKLSRIARAAMEELISQGKADFLLLGNLEVAEWWAEHVEADRREKERLAEIDRRETIRQEALARLTEEEKEILGLNTNQKKSVAIRAVFPEEEEEITKPDKWDLPWKSTEYFPGKEKWELMLAQGWENGIVKHLGD